MLNDNLYFLIFFVIFMCVVVGLIGLKDRDHILLIGL